jgi:NAD(P)H dehydrogenase (quinone)
MKVLVVYHSIYGNTLKMARAAADGAATVKNADVQLARVPEITPQEVIERNERMKNAFILQKGIPVARIEELPQYDAIIIGSPGKFGNMSSATKHFIDRAAGLRDTGALEGRVGGVFTCGSSTQGGCEATLFSMIVSLLHFGMVVAGIPLSVAREQAKDILSPYGAVALVGDNADRPPNEQELFAARLLGARIAHLAR